jgi:hypothetical protein
MPTFPTVNLNGTNAQALVDQLTNALEEVDDLKWALVKAAPHGRDYPGGREDWLEADNAHRNRLLMVEQIKTELTEIALNVINQRDEREKSK